MSTVGVENLVREVAELRARARVQDDLLDKAQGLIDHFLDRIETLNKRIAHLERVERAAVDLAVRLATMGTVIAHDDVARILRDVVEKEA